MIPQLVKGEMKDIRTDFWKICECVEREKVERLMKSSSITLAFQLKTFDNFSLEDVHDSIREAYRKARVYSNMFPKIRETPNNGICLLGRPGCGKTHLLTAISNELISEGVEVVYFPYVESFEEIKNDMKKEDVNAKRFERLMNAEVVFIDDLFKPPSKVSEYEMKQIFKVINYRYMEKKPIMISSEHDIDSLLSLDEALGSRIQEMCREFRVILKGGREMNYRLREDESA
jgi:DNA replication protein DnaC